MVYSASVQITVEPAIANNTISAAQTFCSSGDPAQLNGSVPTGGNGTFAYQWQSSPDNANWNDIGLATSPDYDPSTISATSYYRRGVSSGTCPMVYSASVQILIEPNLPASVTVVASATTICEGTSVNFTATPANGGTAPTYQWKLNGSDVGSGGTTYTNTSLTNGDLIRCIMTSNATPCLTGSPATSNEVTMTVNPNLPASVSIAASANPVCAGVSVTFTATPTNGGTAPDYQWKLNGADVGLGGTTYTNTSLANGDVVTCIMTSNATPCLTGSPATSNTIVMAVNPLTGVPNFTIGATALCQDSADETYTATAANTSLISYSVLPATAGTIDTNSGVMSWDAAFSGTATITATATGLCGTTNTELAVTVRPTPTASISGSISVCQNATNPNVTFTNPQAFPVTITYNVNGTSQSTIDVDANASTDLAVSTNVEEEFIYNLESIIYQNAPICPSTITGTATITVRPAAPVSPGAITGSSTQCPSSPNQIYSVGSVPNATTYNWTLPLGWVITSGTGTNSITVTSGANGDNGNITVTAENSCGVSTASLLAVTVNPGTPAAPGPISGTLAQCPALTDQVYSITPVPNATTYNWTVPTGWAITSGAGTNSISLTTGAIGQNGNITVTAESGCGISLPSSLAVSINQIEVNATIGTSQACYATVKDAFFSINNGVHKGDIIVKVHGSATETASAVLNASGSGFSSYTSVLLYPTASGLSISGNLIAPIIDFNGADNVIIDGRVNGTGTDKDLTISNISTNAAASTVRFLLDARNNTVRNCTIQGSSTAVAIGTIFFSTGSTTGNDGNTIANNTITSAGSNLPVNAIYSAGTSAAVDNSGNTISNNDIQDFFSPTLASSGIYVASNSSAWTINGNKLFQTATRTATAANTHRGINIVTASGTGYIISNNIIGRANTAGTGSTTYAGAFANLYRGIEMTVGTAVASSVQGNNIDGISFSTTSASALPGIFSGISVLAGKVDIGTVTGNTIGATTGNGSIVITSTTTAGVITGIYSISASTVNIQNNKIGSISTAGGSAIGYVFNGIYTTGTGNYSISNNSIGSSDTVNSVAIGTSGVTTTGICTLNGINNAATGTISISGNTVQNVTAYGTGASVFNGILNSAGSGTLTLTGNNIIAINNTGTGTIRGISNTAATASTANINSNTIRSSTLTGTAAFTGILNTSVVATTNVNSNTIRSISRTTATGTVTGISSTGAITIALNINDNHLGNTDGGFVAYSVANSSALNGISVTNATGASALSIQNNDIRGIVHTIAGTNAHTYISNTARTLSQNISNNTFTNLEVYTTGSVTFISNSVIIPANGSQTVSGNNIVTGFNKRGVGGTVTLFTSVASTAASGVTVTHQNNNFSNITVTGATAIAGWINTDAGTGNVTKTIDGNIYSNWTGGTGAITVLNVNIASPNNSTKNNNINNIRSVGSITGINTGLTTTGVGNDNIFNNTINTLISTGTVATVVNGISIIATGNTKQIYNNTISNLQANAITTGSVNGIAISGGTANTIRSNKIYDLSSSSGITTGSINGISVSALGSNGSATLQNNIIGNLSAPAASGTNLIRGISLTSVTVSSSLYVYYNTIYLNAILGGTDFGTSGIYHTANITATTANLDLRNNIIVNTSTPRGTGVTVAFRRSAGTAGMLSNFASTSNNNLFFAGIPSTKNLIYSDVVSSAQTFDIYKSGVFTAGTISPRDQASITEDIGSTFLSITGSDATFLHIDPTKTTLTESGAINIGGIADDFDGEIRQGNAGYVGTGTAPDIGADEFAGDCVLAITSATVAASPICPSETTLLTANGVSGINAIVTWWSETGGTGTNFGTGLTLVAGPGTYYARVTGNCGTPVEAPSITVVSKIDVGITSVTVVASPICSDATTTLTANGVVGTNAVVTWWSATGGTGTNYGTGTTLTNAAPGTYYARVTGDCGTPVEASVTVASTPSAGIVSVTGTSPLCIGSTATYLANSVVLGGGTGAWSSSNPATATVDASGLVTGVASGTCDIIYTITGGCGGTVSAQRSVTVQRINAIVSDADASSTDCPDFLGPWDANNNSYNPGVSQVIFRVTRESSTTNWGFNYGITGATVYSTSPNPQTGTISGLSANTIDLIFYITNIPGTQQNVTFTTSNVADGNCTETYTTDNSATHTIKPMPAIGSFN